MLTGTLADTTDVVLSLPHRGRLSLLTDPALLGYPAEALFSKIKGRPEFDPAKAPGATGDVISHLSAKRDIDYHGKKVSTEILQNPSHLEVSILSLAYVINICSGSKSCRFGPDPVQTNGAPQGFVGGMPAW
jgi:hypothetical protein